MQESEDAVVRTGAIRSMRANDKRRRNKKNKKNNARETRNNEKKMQVRDRAER